jgi:hypothetical protein
MTPIDLLCLVVAVTAGAGAVHALVVYRDRQSLRGIAAHWQMHYAARDPFRLSQRIADVLPTPGAAGVRVRDLIYGLEDEQYCYIFTVEYTIFTVGTRSRIRSVASFIEPKTARPAGPAAGIDLLLAPGELSRVQQYEHCRSARLAEAGKVPQDQPGDSA